MIVETILDNAQSVLHDDGTVWPRAELLSWLNDGYRQLLAQARAVVRPFQIDVPGRHTWAGTQEWEDRHGAGIFRKFSFACDSGAIDCTYRWEAEMMEGMLPTNSDESATYLWERAYSTLNNDNRFLFILSKAHEMPVKVYWDNKRLIGASTRELDMLSTEWWQQPGQPIFFFPSNGRDGSYEVYQMVTAYNQSYDLREMENGIPRTFSGTRDYATASGIDRWSYSYTDGGSAGVGVPGLGLRITGKASDDTFYMREWERNVVEGGTTFEDSDPVGTFPDETLFGADEISVPIGLGREIRSEDRQYIPAPYDSGAENICGIPRDFKSSDDSITVWEVIVSTRPLTETDTPALIPKQFAKYLKFYVLSRAFSRKGQGFKPDMAQHYTGLFQIGVGVLTKIKDLGFIDRVYGRQSFTGSPSGRPPRVQFPSNFEQP